MQRQNCYYNHPSVPTKWTQGVPKGASLLKKGKKTLKRLRLLILLLLSCLVKSPPIRARPTRRIRTTNKVSGVAENRDRVVVPTSLSRVSILFLRKKRRTLRKLSAILAIGKGITLTNVFEIRRGS